MTGQLSGHPLAELIREIAAKALSGSLRLEHDGSRVVAYFDGGRLLYAATNVRELRLAQHLAKNGLVSEAQLARLSGKSSDVALASALVSEGTVSRENISSALLSLVLQTLRLALLWTEGNWDFDGRARLRGTMPLEVSVPALLLEVARQANQDFVASRLQDADELISPAVRPPEVNNLSPEEGFLVSRVDAQMKLGEIVALGGLREPDVLRMVYGLSLAGLLERERWPAALSAATGKAARKPDQTQPDDEATPPPEAPRDVEKEVNDFISRLKVADNHYAVLDVNAETEPAEIKRSYYALARRYHPDRFRQIIETPLHARIESAFARITQAYETLTDADLRARYNARLAAQERVKLAAQSAPTPAAQPASTPLSAEPPSEDREESGSDEKQRAEENFTEGYAALMQGQINVAISLLAGAARVVPDEPRYRAYYGRALATHEKSRRLAEAELQTAIRLDPSRAEYRVMLAELYRDLGFTKRACGELERALAVDPGNVGARELLGTLK